MNFDEELTPLDYEGKCYKIKIRSLLFIGFRFIEEMLGVMK